MHLDLEIEDELAALLTEEKELSAPALRELLIMDLYRRGLISGGRATEFLGVSRLEFIHRPSRLGIPYFNITPEELDEEIERIRKS